MYLVSIKDYWEEFLVKFLSMILNSLESIVLLPSTILTLHLPTKNGLIVI